MSPGPMAGSLLAAPTRGKGEKLECGIAGGEEDWRRREPGWEAASGLLKASNASAERACSAIFPVKPLLLLLLLLLPLLPLLLLLLLLLLLVFQIQEIEEEIRLKEVSGLRGTTSRVSDESSSRALL